MIPYSQVFDQQTMTRMLDHDPVVQRYRSFFALFDWSVVPEPVVDPSQPGKRPHPPTAYIKARLAQARRRLDLLYPLAPLPAGASFVGARTGLSSHPQCRAALWL